MDAELKQKWIDALRSGEYVQGKYKLRSASEYWCCLGVLCDVCGKGEWIKGDEVSHSYLYEFNGETSTAYLPTTLGLEVESTVFTDMNDRQEKTFAEIADWIEQNL